MDYEKAYNEALERARMILCNISEGERCNDIETIFPELAESEDERIRKVLIAIINDAKNKGYTTYYGEPINDILAYLEKLEEQKPAWSEEDENIRDWLIQQFDGMLPNKNGFYYLKARPWLASLSPHWKPSEEQMGALRRAVNKLAKSDVADSVRLSIMYDNLKKLM